MHGWLILDKPTGITSAYAVGKVKHILKPSKIGHAGTLDPLASGILPLALGEATKTVSYLMSDEKEYLCTVTWGEARSTDDAEGEVISKSELRPTRDEISSILPNFIGIIRQRPPIYSAIKLQGKRSYDLARAGGKPDIAPRDVDIKAIELLTARNDTADFMITCGKGTYIRSLARDLGERLGCFGHISALRRTRVGKFSEKDAVTLADLQNLGHNSPPVLGILPIESVLDDIPALKADVGQARKLKAGLFIPRLLFRECSEAEEGQVVTVLHEGKLQALARVEGNVVKPVRIFHH